MPNLRAKDLARRFGRRLLFRNLSFELDDGESLAVTGANGSGKSTLLRILAGVLTPSKGDVHLRLNGEDVPRERHPMQVGFVAPYLNVYDGFSPRENLSFIGRARRMPGLEARIEQMLDFVSLLDRADDRVATFSSGMKQRVKFAAALMADPPLLLLDEPRVNLDAPGLEMVERVVRRQRARNGLTVVATNDAAEARAYDRSIRIEDFR